MTVNDGERGDQNWLRRWWHVISTQPLAVQVIGAVIATLIIGGISAVLPRVQKVGIASIFLIAGLITLIGVGLLVRLRSEPGRSWTFAAGALLAVTGGVLGGAGTGYLIQILPPGNKPIISESPKSTPAPTPSPTSRVGQYVTPNAKWPKGLLPGDCFNDPSLRSRDDLPNSGDTMRILSCKSRHDMEVIFARDIWHSDQPFPGIERIEKVFDARCQSEFQTYIGIVTEGSVFNYKGWYPTAETWKWGDRAIICLAYHPKHAVDYTVKALGGLPRPTNSTTSDGRTP